jgi:hypothetical protein
VVSVNRAPGSPSIAPKHRDEPRAPPPSLINGAGDERAVSGVNAVERANRDHGRPGVGAHQGPQLFMDV